MEPLISNLTQFSAAVKAYCKTQTEELYQNVLQRFDLMALDSDSESISKLANSYEENADTIVDFFSSLTIMMNDHRMRKSVCFVRSFHLLLQFATESNGNFLSVLCSQHDLVNLTISLLLRSIDEKSVADANRQLHVSPISDCFEILFAVFATSVDFDIALYNLQSLVELLFRKIYKRDDEFVDASLLVLSAALTHERVANDVARLLERCTNLRAFAKALLKLSATGSAASTNASSSSSNDCNGGAAAKASSESSTTEQDFRILCCTFVLSFLHSLPSRVLVQATAEASTEVDKKRPVMFSCACLSADSFQNGVALFRSLLTARLRADSHESPVGPQASRHFVASCGLNVAFTLRLFAAFLRHCAAEFIVPDRAANFVRKSDLRSFLAQLIAALQRACMSNVTPTPPVAELIDAAITLIGTLREWNYDPVNGALDATLFPPPSQNSEGTAGLVLLRKLVRMRKLPFSVRCAHLAVDYALRAFADNRLSADTFQVSVSKLVAALFDNICKSCVSTSDSESQDAWLAPNNCHSLRNSCDMLVVALDSLENAHNTSSTARNAFARAFADLDSAAVCEVLAALCSASIAALQPPADANNNNKKSDSGKSIESCDSRHKRNLHCAPLCALKFAQFALGAFDHDPAEMSTDEPDWRAEFARRTRATLQRAPTALARITHFVLRVCAMSTNGALNKSALRCLLTLAATFDLGGDALESIARRNAETNATCWWNVGAPFDVPSGVATSARLDSQFVRLSVDDRESDQRSTLPFGSAHSSASSGAVSSGGSLSDEAKQVAVMALYEHELSALHMRVGCLEETVQIKTLALEQSERLANQTRCRLLQSEADLRKCRELLRDALTRLDETGCALAQVNERHTQSTQQLDRANEQLVHLRAADSQKRELQLECTALRQQLDVSNRRITTLEEKNVELDRLKQSLIEHNERMRAQYDHLQAELARSEKERIDVANALSMLEMRFKEESSKLAVTEAARIELSNSKRELEDELDKRTKEFDELRRSSIALSTENADIKRRHAELVTTCSDTRAKLQRVEEENAQASAELKKKDATLTMLREILQSRANL